MWGKDMAEKASQGFQFLCGSHNNLNLISELSFLDIISLTASLLLTVLMQQTLITSS